MNRNDDNAELLQAVALYYDGEKSPILSAKGRGDVAQQIIDIANEHEVPLCDNKSLVDFLVTLELGEEIPEKLYVAVAYIIAFAYDLKGVVPGQRNDSE
ncbi:EscU/YscU/HrcU family type III secretion system export apparatus switch protein [Gilvimarinus agarilyticus]|uniref:EscU/YscU/HrcU family type III secretion system export apparatus switch protein n=1 Tax=unclassified Gilvimarinus TaxID=2642066 RepID=UPI001C08ECF3|nr:MULTISPECIES: EscU/YscU/HrcU family type III secretion system export apparatus switch protein [unclassified Gilvimarinus]MBU2887131.1 EscU/YscU/HrcU family type III secretion system export apparatus switch protein [Gilvimarinus agarilyticus]MDO6571790.1 EscU/YscU/HrcU family type III secretion system export apparatus switch protein [Gilvimarinus sp. 2_MG-2023]MDO6745863.1 EscU/YscU/HrcU family type III secretion system export apparatus switch protein [Gilvimarinus sp. 1_MG-2023]